MASTNQPLLLTEYGSNRVLALNAVTLLRDPFGVTNAFNFSADRQTRVMLFAVNIEPNPVIAVQAEAPDGTIYMLEVEYAGSMPGAGSITQITVKLPPQLADAGDMMVSVTFNRIMSNKALIKIN